MTLEVRYDGSSRTVVAGRDNTYQGGISSGSGWSIRWKGPRNHGPTPIEMTKALLDHLTHLQRTSDAASTENAKLLYHIQKALDEYHGKTTMGGSLNNLIPPAPKEDLQYGRCPLCNAKGIARERTPNGNDKCENNHVYPSSMAIP